MNAEFDNLSRLYTEAMKELENEQEAYWNSLTPSQQLAAFCAVSRRIYKGEIEDGGTYRYVLYEIFGFGPEAYAAAQDAGYLAIHNSIYDASHERELLEHFAAHCGVENPAAAATDFYLNKS
jgi:hypothetical protein